MRIIQLIPGTGGTFYCQNCMRDGALVRALRGHNVEVTLVPLYLPLSVDTEGLEEHAPVFFGGVNVYLQQEFSLFRKTPRWIDRFFDSDWVLRQAAAREGSTSAASLGPMTLSMIEGRDGNQRKEIERLSKWLAENEKPDLIHASNALLLGLATELKKDLNLPLVCTLQDEHTWLDAIPDPHRRRCWDAMSRRAREVDAFVAVSEWYAGEMGARMDIPREKITVVPVGMEFGDVGPPPAPPNPPVIGYLSRMSECLGLGLLVDAFIQLKKTDALKDLQLRVTGGKTAEDAPFVKHIEAELARHGMRDDVAFVDEFDKASRLAFLRSLSVLSVPVPEGEAFGTFIIEALACGIPVVQPAAGAFPEIIGKTGGGLLYDPASEDGLREALAQLLNDPARAREMGMRGQEAVRVEYSVDAVVPRLLALYRRLVPS